MMYFSPQPNVLEGADPEKWGLISAPKRGASQKSFPIGFRWIADNGCFTERWNEAHWLSWLRSMSDRASGCIMATAPDVVGDAQTTLERFSVYANTIRKLGYPVGLVAQDGMESLDWPDYDALFVGGTTAWKMSEEADWCIRKAKGENKWVHVGRVNSASRFRHFALMGVDSVDGTTICFNPTDGFRRMNRALQQEPLFTLD